MNGTTTERPSREAGVGTPVVLIIFNRPQLTQRVFAEIRRARPQTLLVIADGPRADRAGEKELCRQARAVVEEVDWPCDVRRNYADENLGCGRRIASGLNWVFEQAEEAIVLEDDCVPAPSFFRFCQVLLERYRHDTRVVHIGTNNFLGGLVRTPYSYWFSKYGHISAWATWRRAWQYFDHALSTWPEAQAGGWLRSVYDDEFEERYWTRIFEWMHRERPNIWGYAWTYACFLHGLSVYPAVNLVTNVGFGEQATHCRERTCQADVPAVDVGEIVHPPWVTRLREADRHTFDRVFGGARMRRAAAGRNAAREFLARGKRKVASWLAFG